MYRKPFPTILNYAKVYVDTKKKKERNIHDTWISDLFYF